MTEKEALEKFESAKASLIELSAGGWSISGLQILRMSRTAAVKTTEPREDSDVREFSPVVDPIGEEL